MENQILTRRNLGIVAGMLTAVALTAGALITSTNTAGADEAANLAPAFTGTTATGETVSLSDYAGKTVILEWTNDGCPYVQKHYAEPVRNMQSLQSEAAEDDIVWLSIISSAPGKQGHTDGPGALQIASGAGAVPQEIILDPEGTIGRLYSAKTTPHMFIITPEGEIAYRGAIDSKRSTNVDDIATAENYVRSALTSLENGEPVQTSATKPYGCSVKY